MLTVYLHRTPTEITDAATDALRKEIGHLLITARNRPLFDGLTIRRGKRKGELVAKLKPGVRERLVHLGYERYLINLVMFYTGLRKIELQRLKVSDLHLNAIILFIDLRKSTTKNAKLAKMPL